MLCIKKSLILILAVLLITLDAKGQQTSRFDSVWTGYFRLNSDGWTAGDATISIPLPDHRVIWLFGDSYTVDVDTTDNTLPCLFQVRNCYTIQDSSDRSMFKTILDTTQTGVNQTTFKVVPNDTTLLWPGNGYFRGDTVYIFLERYHASTLEYLGCYLAKLLLPGLALTGIYPVHYNGADAIYGRAVIADSVNDLLYIYGNKLNWIVWEPVVARCPISNPLAPWEYYTGSGWSSFPAQALKISADPVSPGFSVFKYNGKYYLVTQENGYLECGLGREIYSYESDQPWGPFTGKKLLYTEESKFNGWYLLSYNAQAHPYFIENNELLISYNVNDRVDTVLPHLCPSECKHIWTDRMDADSYRPKFVRVPMDMITGIGSGKDETGKDVRVIREVKVFPDPVEHGSPVVTEIIVTRDIESEILLLDTYGRMLRKEHRMLNRGRMKIPLTAPGQPGIYFLMVRTRSGEVRVTKMVAH